MGEKFFLGVVADDFTGASDAASFLAEAGLSVILCNEIPGKLEQTPDAIVIALKSRTIPADDAVRQSIDAFKWLKSKGAGQIYFKYCATFDSTEKGNIGPVVDAVLDEFGIDFTVVCPALPVNGRIVKDGILYVNGIKLEDSHMKDHPLTPMRDSYVPRLMEKQSKCRAFTISIDEMKAGVKNPHCEGHYCYVPDYYENEHGDLIAETFGDIPFLTGGSGLAGALARRYAKLHGIRSDSEKSVSPSDGKTLLLAGSCSKVTLEQIAEYQKSHESLQILPEKLLNGEQTHEKILEDLKDGILIYSSQSPDEMKKTQALGQERVASAIEAELSNLAVDSVKHGYTKIISAGGETSGAVTKALGYSAFYIGKSVAPGVPVMTPVENPELRIVLKSGGFGQKDFFARAVEMTKE